MGFTVTDYTANIDVDGGVKDERCLLVERMMVEAQKHGLKHLPSLFIDGDISAQELAVQLDTALTTDWREKWKDVMRRA